jgi:hypothetical protein
MPRHTWGTLNEQLDWPSAESRSWGSTLSHAEWHHQESCRPTTAKLTNPGVFLIICQQGHVGGRSPPPDEQDIRCRTAAKARFHASGANHAHNIWWPRGHASLHHPQLGFFTSTSTRDSSHRRSSLRESKSMTGLHLKPHFY